MPKSSSIVILVGCVGLMGFVIGRETKQPQQIPKTHSNFGVEKMAGY